MNLIQSRKKSKSLVNLMAPVALSFAAPTVVIMQTATAHADEATDNTTGWVDVYVDHSNLDDAVSKAESAGVTVVHNDSTVLSGDATQTEEHRATAQKYYDAKTKEIQDTTNKYKNDMANYEATVARNQADADKANAQMDGLKSNLSVYGQTVTVESKQYSADALAADSKAIEASIASGKKLRDVTAEVASATIQEAALTSFQTQADQGNIKLKRETVKITNPGETEQYVEKAKQQYAELQAYIAKISASNGTIDPSTMPTYTLYDFTIAPETTEAGTKPVKIYHYTAVPVTKPAVPVVDFNYFDIRSKPTTDRHAENADGETIVEATKESNNGRKVVQAMVNQTVGVETDNQPLPADRFDKFHSLVINTYLPENATFDEAKSNVDGTNWEASYNKTTRVVTLKATNKYLVQVNKEQSANRGGTVGGTVGTQFTYDAPAVYFKLDKDDETYQVHSETIVNDEYMVVGDTITIQTNSANPTKHNFNSKMVNIDGKAVLPGSINNYVIGLDYDQYKGVNIDKEMQSKGTSIVDYYPADALEVTGPIVFKDRETGKVLYTSEVAKGAVSGTFVDSEGKAVNGLTWSIISKDAAPDKIKEAMDEKGKAIKIDYTQFDNSFYKTYIEGGKNVDVVIPMTTLKIDNTPDKKGGTYNGNKYSNVAWQSDFGNEYKTNTVENEAPLLDPRKDAVLSFANLTSLDINANPQAEIENGTTFKYRLSGSEFPMNLSEGFSYYALSDDLNVKADEYTGNYIVESNNPITFKQGTALYNRYARNKGVMDANTDITKFTTQTIARNVSKDVNTKTGTTNGADTQVTRVMITFDQDFLDQIDFDKTAFHVDAFLDTKRIADVDNVTNEFNEIVNGIDFGSTEVITNTKQNRVDELKDTVSKLDNTVKENAEKADKFQSETISSLSVIVKNIQTNKDAIAKNTTDIQSNAKNIDKNSTAIVNLAKELGLAVQQVNTNTKDIATNKTAIKSNTTAIAAIISLVKEVANPGTSTLTIYESSVKSDADALHYAVDYGIAPRDIKLIKANEQGKFVITYVENGQEAPKKAEKSDKSDATAKDAKTETSKVGVKAEAVNKSNVSVADVAGQLVPAVKAETTDKKVETQPKVDTKTEAVAKTSELVLYTVKTQEAAYAQLEKLGYSKDRVKELKDVNGNWTAKVQD